MTLAGTWLAILALAAGIAKLTAIVVNWLEAHPLHHLSFLITKIVGVSAPFVAMAWYCHGFFPQADVLAIYGRPTFWEWYGSLLAGSAGFVLLMAAAVRFQLRSLPANVRLKSSSRYDFWKAHGPLVLGSGRSRWFAQLPGNESFLLDADEFEISLRQVPAEWDGLKIAHFSDVHFRGGVGQLYFERVFETLQRWQPDLILFSGDLIDNPACMAWIPTTLGRLKAPLGCWYVLGNHDWLQDAPRIRNELNSFGWQDVSGTAVEVRRGGSAIYLAGTESPWMGEHPDVTNAPASAFRILISHTPDHFGWARQHAFDLMVAGHTHGGQIRLPILGPIFSPSVYGVRYSAGEFWTPPTLMVVSRGISGRDALRYGCTPQIALLTVVTGKSSASPTAVESQD